MVSTLCLHFFLNKTSCQRKLKGVQKKVNFLNLIKNHRNNLARSLKIYQMLDINPQFHIQSRKMHPDVKIKLKKEIEVFLEKNPESNVSDLRRFLKLGSTGDLIAQFKKSSFSMFLKRNYEVQGNWIMLSA